MPCRERARPQTARYPGVARTSAARAAGDTLTDFVLDYVARGGNS
jgi:hypothetical protein